MHPPHQQRGPEAESSDGQDAEASLEGGLGHREGIGGRGSSRPESRWAGGSRAGWSRRHRAQEPHPSAIPWPQGHTLIPQVHRGAGQGCSERLNMHPKQPSGEGAASQGCWEPVIELAGLDTWDPGPSLESKVGPLREGGATTALRIGCDVSATPRHTDKARVGGVAETESPGGDREPWPSRRTRGPAPQGGKEQVPPRSPGPPAPGGSPCPLHL